MRRSASSVGCKGQRAGLQAIARYNTQHSRHIFYIKRVASCANVSKNLTASRGLDTVARLTLYSSGFTSWRRVINLHGITPGVLIC